MMRRATSACALGCVLACSPAVTREGASPEPSTIGQRDASAPAASDFDASAHGGASDATTGVRQSDASGEDGQDADAAHVDGPLGSYRGSPPEQECARDDAARLSCCVFEKVNAFRGEHGTAPYNWEPTLSRAAFDYAMTMAKTGHFDHRDLDGNGPGERLAAFGVSDVRIAENLHSNTFADVMRACTTTVHGDPQLAGGWENSKTGHREIMLGLRPGTQEPLGLTHAGIGAAWNGRAWYVDMYVAQF